jgi:hypothetical protein
MHRRNAHRGLSRSDALVIPTVVLALVVLLVPALAGGRSRSEIDVSASNLRVMHSMHECYAADWGGRQFTAVPDDLGAYGSSRFEAFSNFRQDNGYLPPVILGWECDASQGLWGFWTEHHSGNFQVAVPTNFDDPGHREGVGAFRLPNCWPLHEYAAEGTGRVYDPVFYAPLDRVVYKPAKPLFALDCEFIPQSPGGSSPLPASYVMSPAAMFHPDVLRAPSRGGFQDPFSLPWGLESPAVSQVLYPHLKTRMIEHNWLQDPPGPCNEPYEDPMLPGDLDDCSPYVFNHGLASVPLALFYDGSVAKLPIARVVQDDARILGQTGGVDGLWSRDTPLGPEGYFGQFAVDGTLASPHILTTDGIRGRDRLR